MAEMLRQLERYDEALEIYEGLAQGVEAHGRGREWEEIQRTIERIKELQAASSPD